MELLIVWLVALLFSAVGAIITLLEKNVDIAVVSREIRDINSSSLDIDSKEEQIVEILHNNRFKTVKDNNGYIRATLKRFSAGWFIFWSGFLLIIGSLIYCSYFWGIKKKQVLKINIGKKETPEQREQNNIEKLEKLSTQFKNNIISEEDFNTQKDAILAEMKS